MTSKTYYDQDINVDLIKAKTVGILGYGAQGQAHALNLRDSGVSVIVAQRDKSERYRQAIDDGFDPVSIEEATSRSDVLNLLLPDEVHGKVFESQIKPYLDQSKIVMSCHGFSLHYGQVVPPEGVATVLVAPKGAGHRVRSSFVEGSGVPFLIALGQNANDETRQLGLAYAGAMGGGKIGVIETTIAAETETDLFGEQAVLCGGVSHLVKAAFDTLIDAGYQEELAYFECVHELKLVVDLIHDGGLAYMRKHISNTAEYGDYTRGPRIIDAHVERSMKEILAEIQSGQFAKEMQQEFDDGGERIEQFRRDDQSLLVEKVGQALRERMSR